MKWTAAFSQTGREIRELAEALGRWPDYIYTNNFNEEHWSHNIPVEKVTILTPKVFNQIHAISNTRDFITLHGWLRILPAEVCEKHDIYNGHPALIHDHPELKGKDPQESTWLNLSKYYTIGSVVHKVTAEVDEGEVIESSSVDVHTVIDKDDLYEKLRQTSLRAWINFLQDKVMDSKPNAIRPSHYKGEGKYECIDVIEDLCKTSTNDTFTDYNRFQAFKYIWRAGNKDPVLQDLKKAVTFLQFAIQHEEKKNEQN